MSLYWISWHQPTDDYRPAGYPPNAAVLGWWCTGEARDGATICALVKAANEDGARASILLDWAEAHAWRFCEPRDTTELSDRFPLADWMRPRLADTTKGTNTQQGDCHDSVGT